MISFHSRRTLQPGFVLLVVGEIQELGNWDPLQALVLVEKWNSNFVGLTKVSSTSDRFEYKFVEFNPHTKQLIWDQGSNREAQSFPLTSITNQIKLMTYNIRYDNPKDELNCWFYRKERCLEVILNQKPTIFGLQEVLIHQKNYLQAKLSEYDFISRGRDIQEDSGEASPIFYRKDIFLAFQNSIEAGTTFAKNGIPRIATLAIFKWFDRKQRILVINTHLDHESETARESSQILITKEIYKQLSSYPHKINLIIVMGDFNTSLINLKDLNQDIQILEKSKNLLDKNYQYHFKLQPAMQISNYQTKLNKSHSFTGFGQGPFELIDYIFISTPTDQYEVNKYYLCEDSTKGYSSDHLALCVELNQK